MQTIIEDPYSPMSAGPGSPDHASSPMSPDNYNGGYGSTKDQFLDKKKEPNPFTKCDLEGNITKVGSPLKGRHVEWSMKGEVPLEDVMYPSLHATPASWEGNSNYPRNMSGSDMSSLAKKKLAPKKQKKGRRMSTFQRKLEEAESVEYVYDPKKGVKWEVSIGDVDPSTLEEALPSDSPADIIDKDMDKIGELYLRLRLKRNMRRTLFEREQKKKAAIVKSKNLLLNAYNPNSLKVEKREEIFVDLWNGESKEVDAEVAKEQGLDHLRADDHALTVESPDDLYSNLVQKMKDKVNATTLFPGISISPVKREKTPDKHKHHGSIHGTGSLYGTQGVSAEQESYTNQRLIMNKYNKYDREELDNGVLYYRINNELHYDDHDDSSVNSTTVTDRESEAIRRRKAKVHQMFTKDRLNTTASGNHLKRTIRENNSMSYGIDYEKQHEEFNKLEPLYSHSEVDRSKLDFSPIHKSPSYSKQVSADLLLTHQFNAKILPERFIKPYVKITPSVLKDALEEEKVQENLTSKQRKLRKRENLEQKDAHFMINMKAYGVGDEQGLCLGMSLHKFESLEKLILAENRLTMKSIPTIFGNINSKQVLFIDLSNNKINGKVCSTAIKKYFKQPNVCKHINLSGCGMRCQDLVSICEGLTKNHEAPLEELILKENKIANKGAIALAAVMTRIMTHDIDPLCSTKNTEGQCISKLNTVNFGWNDIGYDGINALAEAIKISKNLKNIDLSANGINDDAAQLIGSAIAISESLEVINLAQNQVASPACFVFARVLRGHVSMKVMDLSLNPLGEPGARSIFRTILNGLRCFVMMRSCTFEKDESIFNHSNPAADSPYKLNLSAPYDASVANTLIEMMSKDPDHCKITSASHKVNSKTPAKNIHVHVIDGKVCEKSNDKEWVCPLEGELELVFDYKERIPTQALKMTDHALFVLQIIIVTARSEEDRRNWLRLLVRDVFCTTEQAQGIINHFLEKQVIGIGGLKKVDIIVAVWGRLLDPQNMVDFFLKNINSKAENSRIMLSMGFDLFKFNWINPTGRWRFNLEDENQRTCMLKFITINAIESEFSEKRSGREDTSQMEDWSNFRNATYEGGIDNDDIDTELDQAQTQSDDKFVFKPFVIDKEFRENLPYVGIVEFDYVSTKRPMQDHKEASKNGIPSKGASIDSNETTSADIEEKDIFDANSGMFANKDHDDWFDNNGDDDFVAPHMRTRPGSSTSRGTDEGSLNSPPISRGNSREARSRRDTDIVTTSRPGSSVSVERTTTPKSRSTSIGYDTLVDTTRLKRKTHPQDYVISENELADLLKLLGLSTRIRIQPPETYIALAYLQLAATKYFFEAKHVNIVLECFSRAPDIQARVVVTLFSRIWDLHNSDIILRNLSTLAQKETISRIGYLNIINPLKPALDYDIDMRYVDSRKCLVFCLETAPSEDASQLRGDMTSDLTLTDMYSSINRVKRDCLDARVMFNYGEVGERSQNVSWNLRMKALKYFLVGTQPTAKTLHRVIIQYNKMLKAGTLSLGPIENQYEHWLKRQAEEKDADAKKKARLMKVRNLVSLSKKVTA